MDVECLVQQPSNDQTFDGSAALVITGGTPPYTIFWEVGSFAPALTNLGIGSYTATVTDYYGDFSATTTCVLTAETLSLSAMCFEVRGVTTQPVFITTQPQGLLNGKPYYFLQYGVQNLGYVYWNGATNLWTFCVDLDCQVTPINTLDNGDYFYPTGATNSWVYNPDNSIIIVESTEGPCIIPVIPKEEYDLCVSLLIRDDKEYLNPLQTITIQLDPSNEINGEPSWTSSTGEYLIYWNTGSTPSQWTMTGYPSTIFTSNNPAYPPLSNWQISGPPEVLNITVVTGTCTSAYTINVTFNKNDSQCEEGGSITVYATGGVTPYTYSIDGGQFYQASPIFNNLQPGNYNIIVKDSNNVVSSVLTTQLLNNPPSQYTVTLSANYVANTYSITAPTLPPGVKINVNLVAQTSFGYYGSSIMTQPSLIFTPTISGTNITNITNTTSSFIPLTGPCTIPGPLSVYQTQTTYTYNVTLSSNQVVTGNTTSLILSPPTGKCKGAKSTYQLSLSNAQLINCECCNIITANPKLRPPLVFP